MLQRRYLAVLGLIVLSLLLYFALPAGPSLRLKMVVTQIFSPVLRAGAALRNSWGTARHEFQSRAGLLDENRRLREQLALQMQESLRVMELEDENRRLRAMAGFRQANAPRLRAARLIGRDPSNWWKTIFIDAGSDDGVRENCAVVTPEGLVGKTISVGNSSACVVLIVDPNCKVASMIQETREPGIVEGSYTGAGATAGCRMEFISRDAHVVPGQTVITSGLGGIFPKGLRVGSIEKVGSGEAGLYKSVSLKPAVHLDRLEEVFVVIK